MRERPYRIFFAGGFNDMINIIVPNYFANFKYVKVKVINLGLDLVYDYSNNIALCCSDHSFDATYGRGLTIFAKRPSLQHDYMFNISPLLQGMKPPYAFLPYRNQYGFYLSDLSESQTPSEITLVLELEPINFN